jgi:PilZ domain
MVAMPDRRRVARLTVPRHLRGGELELHLVHVLDLSPLGARITHLEPLHEGVVCYVDLPPALGRVRLTGRVVWTRLRGTEQTLEGERRCHHESGIEFTNLTPDQQTALAAALATLQAAQDTPDREASR